MNPYKQLIVGGHRFVDVSELENVRGTIPVLDYRLHDGSEDEDRMHRCGLSCREGSSLTP
jgi:hypothetical protein